MGINWGALVAQDRCKAFGVPWTEEDLNAIHKLGIPPAYVRNGVVTLSEYKKTQGELDSLSEKPLRYMNKTELMAKAGELGLQFTPEVTKSDLILLIESKLPKQGAQEDAPEADKTQVLVTQGNETNPEQ